MNQQKKNISAYLFEIITVVIGITIALALDSYILNNVAFHPREDRILSADPLKTNEAINLLGSFFNMMSKRNQDYNELIDHCNHVKGILSSAI